MRCSFCGSLDLQKRGMDRGKQRYFCRNCKRFPSEEKRVPKVLVFDIETLPMEFYGWKLWDMITSPDFIIRDWCVLNYAAKWLFQSKVMTRVLTSQEALDHNDKKMVEEIWTLFDQADIIIAHNGVSFDLSKMNSRFLFYGLNPPSHYQNVDTFLTAKKAFGFSSNALDYMGAHLGLGRKHKTDFEWWRECAKGNPKYLSMMNKYNVRDIALLEDVYVKLRPWIKHPNMSLFMDLDKTTEVCPRCGSKDIVWEGKYHTEVSVFDAFRCKNCGGIGRARKSGYVSPTRSTQSL